MGIVLTSPDCHNLESNRNSLQRKRSMALDDKKKHFMTKITCISSSVSIFSLSCCYLQDQDVEKEKAGDYF